MVTPPSACYHRAPLRLRDIERRIGDLEQTGRILTGAGDRLALLVSLAQVDIPDAGLLARFHDALLFLCAYPETPQILRRAESLLKRFHGRIAAIERSGDISPLLDPEISGIAGTWVDAVFSCDFVRWLAQRFPGQLEIDWDDDANPESRAGIFTRLLPFLAEEASVDANVPYRAWLDAARASANDGGLGWLLRNLDAPQYDSLQLWIKWTLGDSPTTRTRMRRPPPVIFYQRSPLLLRRDVSVARELAGEPLPIGKLSRREGGALLDMARAAIAIRYRELYCFTWGDPEAVLSADCGRGLEIVLIGILPEKRLPLRAGFGAFFLRNGVPIGYADALGLGERMEVSFNIFYAFRSGESAFCFARLLALYHQMFGSTSFSIDPYQLGMGNDEAIEAGAFWFYRKLGFRATDPLVERMARRQQKRMLDDPRHRTSARTLRSMARSPLVYDMDGGRESEWDRFHIRNIGLSIQKRFARSGQSAEAFTESCRERVATTLHVAPRALGKLALVLDAIPDLKRWTADERAGVHQIVRAKAGRSEERYLRLLSRHERLRRALLKLGRRGA